MVGVDTVVGEAGMVSWHYQRRGSLWSTQRRVNTDGESWSRLSSSESAEDYLS